MKSKEEVKKWILDLQKNLGRRPIKRDNNYLYFMTRKIFGGWNKAMTYSGIVVKPFQKISLPELDKNFYYFFGLLITDGHLAVNTVKRKNYQIKIYTSFIEEKELILKLIFRLFNYKASVRARKTGFSDNLNYEIYISSKELCAFLEKKGIPSGEKSRRIRIPEFLFTENNNNIASFIRGVIDGDGSIGKNSVKVSSGSENFLKDFSRLINKINISCGKVCCEKEELFNLWICKHDDLIRLRLLLYDNAEYFYPRKRDSWFNKI